MIIILILMISLLFNLFFLQNALIDLSKKNFTYLKYIIKKFILSKQNDVFKNENIVSLARGNTLKYCEKVTDLSNRVPLTNDLILKPGNYVFAECVYPLIQEGLYRFSLPEKYNAQRIVYMKDIKILMSSLAWLIMHGTRDDKLTYRELIVKAKKEKLALTCESSVRFAYQLLTELSISARIVGSRTLAAWNSYDNGHYLIEVFDGVDWVLYDLNSQVYFMSNGIHLSLNKLLDCKSNFEVVAFASAPLIHLDSSHYDYTFITEARLANLKQWYQRIMQFSFIEIQNEKYSFIDFNIENLKQYPKGAFPEINYVTKQNFINKFY